jgi:hypothetical protein
VKIKMNLVFFIRHASHYVLWKELLAGLFICFLFRPIYFLALAGVADLQDMACSRDL